MKRQLETLESTKNFVVLRGETIAEAKRELEMDVQQESIASRRLDALRMALCNLSRLEIHVSRTSRILNDVRTLRHLLFEEATELSNTSSHTSLHAPLSSGDQAQAASKLKQSMAGWLDKYGFFPFPA